MLAQVKTKDDLVVSPAAREAIDKAKQRSMRERPRLLWDALSPAMKARLEYGSRYGVFPDEAGLTES